MPKEIDLGFCLNLRPEEALKYLITRMKKPQPTWHWTDMWQEDHARAFTVAKSLKYDILQDISQELISAMEQGKTFQEFRNSLQPTLQKKGWWGKKEVDGKEVQLGSPHRLKTIFNVNIQTAYQVGHYRHMTDPDVLTARPYWRYVAVNDARTRPQHRAWHGTILPASSKWWDTHYPPNGWNCRCTVVSMSADEAKDRISKEPPEENYTWENPKTGEKIEVPVGIDPGWAYNPGRAYLNWAHEIETEPIQDQKTWKDFGRPDLRKVPVSDRLPAPTLLKAGKSKEEALEILTSELGFKPEEKYLTIKTFDNDMAVVERDYLEHVVEKRQDAREQYAKYIIPTLQNPYEIYLTEYPDGLRKRYIGLFTGKKNLLVVIRMNRDGSLLWNVMQARDKDMNKARIGWLLWGK